MTDQFGVGAMLQAFLLQYINVQRGTGRTEALVDTLQDGDVVVCASHHEASNLIRRARDRNKQVSALVVIPGQWHDLERRLAGRRVRLHFDHTWVEDYYLQMLKDSQQVLESVVDRFRMLENAPPPEQPQWRER